MGHVDYAMSVGGANAVVSVYRYALAEPIVLISHDAHDAAVATRLCSDVYRQVAQMLPQEDLILVAERVSESGAGYTWMTNAGSRDMPQLSRGDRSLHPEQLGERMTVSPRDLVRDALAANLELARMRGEGGVGSRLTRFELGGNGVGF